MSISLAGQVAIVTGAGRGLGRVYALALAQRGAKLVINGRGSNGSVSEQAVVDEIIAAGGEAVLEVASVTDDSAVTAMVERVITRWGRIDILVNNAGFVIDQSFSKLVLADFQQVMDVHVGGAVRCTQAVWPHMLKQAYGRVIMISSSAGLAGNFGQAAYASAKMAVIGLMYTLGLEGERKGIKVNSLAPFGSTEMNEAYLDAPTKALFSTDKVAPAIVFLASAKAPNRQIIMAGGGSFEAAYIAVTQGALVQGDADALAASFEQVSSREQPTEMADSFAQMQIELNNIKGASQ